MDKTTTWLVRGASIIIILVGFLYLKPYFQKLEETRIIINNRREEMEAQNRCRSMEKISYSKFLNLVNSGEVKELIISGGELSELKTNNDNFVVSLAPDSNLLNLLTANNVDFSVGGSELCK